MRFFVASWFFPPSTSSEGIVTYKLFRNSKHTYDVCSSQSRLWSYQHALEMDASNIRVFPVDTNEFETWIEESVKLFEKLHAENPYDAIMTRSMPPESVEVARRIKEKYPSMPWVASLADPISKSPYDIKGLILEAADLSEADKANFGVALRNGADAWKSNPHPGIKKMCEFKDIEDYVVNNADAIIFPHDTLKTFVLGSRCRKNVLTVHHSFDRCLFPEKSTEPRENSDVTTLAFIGHSDEVRTLEPIVRAMNLIRTTNPETFDKLRIRFIGNVTDHVRELVYNYYLHNHISIEPGIDYISSLGVMESVDWAIHIDAYFDFMDEPGGSIFFAGKIADYMGTDVPILALTGRGTPAYEIVRRAGGLCVEQTDLVGIADALQDIAEHRAVYTVDRAYRDRYAAKSVAAKYDTEIEVALDKNPRAFTREFWPEVPAAEGNKPKLLTVCIPSYKVECYLDRCLHSLISCPEANELEIFVVNDGSPDSSREIGLAYAEHYPSIVSVIDKENGGHGSTINAALRQATGTYFRVIDGDDWVDSRNLATLIKNVRAMENPADLISTNYHQVFAEDGHEVPWMKKGPQDNYTPFTFAEEDFTNEYFTIHSMTIKTDVLRRAKLEIQEHTFYVDVEYTLFPIPYVETVMFTPEFVYRYAVGNADQSINPDNFVKRYDHHDRVIRRTLAYYEEYAPTMGKGQKIYMESIIKKVLRTHYTLSLVWDTQRERGFARAADFDAFLKETSPSLYNYSHVMWPYVKKCQSCGFDPAKVEPVGELEANVRSEGVKALGRKIARGPVMHKVVYNRYTKAVARRVLK